MSETTMRRCSENNVKFLFSKEGLSVVNFIDDTVVASNPNCSFSVRDPSCHDFWVDVNVRYKTVKISVPSINGEILEVFKKLEFTRKVGILIRDYL